MGTASTTVKTGIPMRGILKMTCSRVRGPTHGKTVESLPEHTKMAKCTVLGNSRGLMDRSTKETILRTKSMAQDVSAGLMDAFTTVSGRMDLCMEREATLNVGSKRSRRKEYGRKGRSKGGLTNYKFKKRSLISSRR